jgi:retron-type reverse transcriptase
MRQFEVRCAYLELTGRAARRLNGRVDFLRSITGLLDRGRNPAKLAEWLGLRLEEIEDWAEGKPPEPRGREYYYTRFTIPKRDGRQREIDAPSEALKALQRRVLLRLLNPLPMPKEVTGFVRGRSVVDNAAPHAGRDVVINLDLQDFFPRIKAEQVRQCFLKRGWSQASANILTNICTHEGHLPQGAPTSPALSNLVARRMDTRLARLAARCGGSYTRYADDLTFSFPLLMHSVRTTPGNARAPIISLVRLIIEEEGFSIQWKKRVRIQRAHQRQTATGLVVNARVNLPREFRRRIRAAEHHERLGKLGPKEKARLRGWQAWQSMVARQSAQSDPSAIC